MLTHAWGGERNRAVHLRPLLRPQTLTIPTRTRRPEQPPRRVEAGGVSESSKHTKQYPLPPQGVRVRNTTAGGGGAKIGHTEARRFPNTNVVMSHRLQLSSQQRRTLKQLACRLQGAAPPQTSPRTTSRRAGAGVLRHKHENHPPPWGSLSCVLRTHRRAHVPTSQAAGVSQPGSRGAGPSGHCPSP